MKAGHPFENSALDELRAEQRRALRLLPDSVIAEAAPGVGPDVDGIPVEDRPLVEMLLRSEARELLGDRQLAKLIDSWRQQTQVETLADFYERNQARAEQLAVGPQAAFFDQVELARLAHRDRELAALPVELAPNLRRLLLLLVWADHLSDYRDPRVENLPAATDPPRATSRHEVAPPHGTPTASSTGDTAEFEAVTEPGA